MMVHPISPVLQVSDAKSITNSNTSISNTNSNTNINNNIGHYPGHKMKLKSAAMYLYRIYT